MPPHCDSMDGPVVRAAREALDTENVEMILPYVHKSGEDEIRSSFELALKARTQGPEARQVADLFFFESAVRVHRAGEGAPYTGLKPAGLDVGPVIPLAEEVIASGDPAPLGKFLADAVRRVTTERFAAMSRAKESAGENVDAARAYVEAMLGLQVWAHKLYGAIYASAHDGSHRE
jgi:Family of unknown function (DUF6448)